MLKYIVLGTDCKEYFNYDGKPLPIRPLSTYEMDQILMKSVEGVSPLIFNSVLKVKLGLLKDNEEDIKLDKFNYRDFLIFYNEIDYWTVYNSMKDFQDESFSFPDYEKEFRKDFEDWDENKPKGYYFVRKMTHVHEIAKDILTMTTQPPEKIVKVLTNADGKTLASIVHKFHQPLVSEAWKLTPIQTSFIYYSSPDAPQVLESVDDLPGIKKGTYKEVMQQLKDLGF